MIKAKHHIIIYPFFQWLTRFMLKRNFNSIIINGAFKDTGAPVLIIANHMSWWDGFWVMHLNLNLFRRKFHFMMLEDQLNKHWYFKYTGGFSIKRKSRGIFETLNYCIGLLKQKGNMVLLFPQGRIHSMYSDIIHFEKGIEHILNGIALETQIVFVANLPDYLSNAKPNLFTYVKSLTAKDLQKNNIEDRYNEFYTQAINNQKLKCS